MLRSFFFFAACDRLPRAAHSATTRSRTQLPAVTLLYIYIGDPLLCAIFLRRCLLLLSVRLSFGRLAAAAGTAIVSVSARARSDRNSRAKRRRHHNGRREEETNCTSQRRVARTRTLAPGRSVCCAYGKRVLAINCDRRFGWEEKKSRALWAIASPVRTEVTRRSSLSLSLRPACVCAPLFERKIGQR